MRLVSTGPKVEHLFRVIERQCGYLGMRFLDLAKYYAAQWDTLFALSRLWRVTDTY